MYILLLLQISLCHWNSFYLVTTVEFSCLFTDLPFISYIISFSYIVPDSQHGNSYAKKMYFIIGVTCYKSINIYITSLATQSKQSIY